MHEQSKSTALEWRQDRIPIATRFDDPYYSLDDGLAETEHVFLAGNHLPTRFRAGFHIAELGFGTGLNMLAAWSLWRQAAIPGPLRFTSFEAYPLSRSDMARALAQWPQLGELRDAFLGAYRPCPLRFRTPDLDFQLIIGDANQRLPMWHADADAWFLDGFSPDKNPQLWNATLMADVADHTRPNGSFATYTAAGHVRKALSEAGFTVTRVKGFGRKRHMSIGVLAPRVLDSGGSGANNHGSADK